MSDYVAFRSSVVKHVGLVPPCRAGPLDGERASTMLRSCAEGAEDLGLVLPIRPLGLGLCG